jgi:hypothetical protein
MALGVVLRYGAQHSRFDGCQANLGLGRRRGGSCPFLGEASRVVMLALLPGRCPYTSSRVRLTGDLELYSDQCGGVSSAQALTVLGMAPQCPGWRHSDGDGRTGPDVTEELRYAGLTPRCHPGRALSW